MSRSSSNTQSSGTISMFCTSLSRPSHAISPIKNSSPSFVRDLELWKVLYHREEGGNRLSPDEDNKSKYRAIRIVYWRYSVLVTSSLPIYQYKLYIGFFSLHPNLLLLLPHEMIPKANKAWNLQSYVHIIQNIELRIKSPGTKPSPDSGLGLFMNNQSDTIFQYL